ncbi:fumarate and nitrate reduction regulatory protein [Oxobacter pfennigii]|uniref:Fumarate and nitrate reduction regulatory protein n=1 Tax=Oxobacter pfennigii TaxID=36849 RepID=A0A0P8WSH1_9CLOT|nr:Crp/Fnr family transcriptional regulator [Oxobacter pfennigii]KPU45548.1 fumarate and nitrate reduction regulatory protein [Oxobacter pfennigii]
MNRDIKVCEHCGEQLCTKRVPIFSALNDEELNKVTDLIIRRRYLKGERVIQEGSDLENLIIIHNGKVKAFKDTLEGREQILYIFAEGDFFGEKNLLKQQSATYNVEALEETNTCMINRRDFQRLLFQYPDISAKIIDELSSRLERLESMMQNMGTRNIDARVNAVLLEFSKKYGKGHPKGIIIELPLSREGIANYIGVARETVSRKMSHLQDDGIIEMVGNKRVIILDKEALEREVI